MEQASSPLEDTEPDGQAVHLGAGNASRSSCWPDSQSEQNAAPSFEVPEVHWRHAAMLVSLLNVPSGQPSQTASAVVVHAEATNCPGMHRVQRWPNASPIELW